MICKLDFSGIALLAGGFALLSSGGCNNDNEPVRAPPPTGSSLVVQLVTYACNPLRAEFTIDNQVQIRGLYLKPDCPTPDMELADCYDPPAGHPQCLAKCDVLTTWKHLGGTAPMHVFTFPLLDDGTNSGPLVETVHLTLSTLDGTLVWDGDQTEQLALLPDHRAGYFHSGLTEFDLTVPVLKVLGQNCLSAK